MSKRKLFEEAVKKLGKPKDFPKTNFKKAFDDYDKQIKRKKNIKEIKKAAVPAALGTAGGTAGGTYVAKNKKKAGGAIKAMKKGGMAMADRAGTRAMDPRMAMAMKDVAKGAAFGNPKTRKKIKEGITGAAKKIKSKLGMKKGGMVSSASKRADGCVTKGRTRGKMV